MNRKLILIASMALVLAACGDSDVATTDKPSTLNKAMDSAGDAVETTSEVVHDAAQGSADATRPEDMTTEEALEYMDKEMEKLAGE